MCQFFSFVTDPVGHPAEYYHFDWEMRQKDFDGADSHSHICARFKLDEDVCNKYEFNPLTKAFTVDQINSNRDDSEAAEKWANRQDFKEIVEPLIIKPIVKPVELPKVEQVTDEQIGWLKEWASVGSSVWDSVGSSVWASVGDAVGDAVWDAVWDAVGDAVWDAVGASVRDLVLDSVWASVWAYIGSFFDIDYKYDFAPSIKLWESGLVPSFDGTTWRLYTGKDARVVYEWTPDKECEE